MTKHIELGKKGELLAKNFLADKGYIILETNWRHEKDEVDIIAMDGDELVIVEVKTRSSDFFGFPEDAVGVQKEAFLIRAAENYLDENNLDLEVRYDIVAIILKPKETQIKHIVDAFFPA